MSEILQLRLNDANFLYSVDGGSSDLQQVGVEHEASQQVIANLGRISQALEEVPHNETGLNLARMNGFFERYGLAAQPFVGVDEAGQQAINEIMDYGRGPTQTVANHFPILGFTYVLRGGYESARGLTATEAEGIHELAHANQPHRDILMRRTSVGGVISSLLRNGFTRQSSDGTRNNYFEEGFAELMQHKYIIEELGLPHGFLGRTEPQKIEEHTSEGLSAEYLLPGNYLYTTTLDGSPKWHKSAHAAYGMQLLIAQDPAIFSAIVASRKGTDGLREFAGRVDALDQGLRSMLGAQIYDHRAFAQATRLIIDKLYDGDQERALLRATEQDSRELMAA